MYIKKGLIQEIFNSEYNNCMKIEELVLQKSTRNSRNEIKDIYSVSNKDGFILQSEHYHDYRQVNSQFTLLYEDIVPLEFKSIKKTAIIDRRFSVLDR